MGRQKFKESVAKRCRTLTDQFWIIMKHPFFFILISYTSFLSFYIIWSFFEPISCKLHLLFCHFWKFYSYLLLDCLNSRILFLWWIQVKYFLKKCLCQPHQYFFRTSIYENIPFLWYFFNQLIDVFFLEGQKRVNIIRQIITHYLIMNYFIYHQ